MRVLFLGAGASKAAEYPAASSLLKVIEDHIKENPHLSPPQFWEDFEAYRKKSTGILEELLNSSNPEIILSQIDLLLEERKTRETGWWYALGEANDRGAMEEFRERPHPFDDEPPELKNARQAQMGLEAAVDRFFTWRHQQDRLEEAQSRSRREYLRCELKSLSPGDAILTTNWDTLAERTLSELGLWFPTDGYGIAAPLRPYGIKYADIPLSDLSSKVHVLKLHGSVGWHSLPRKNSWYLRYANFLQFLPIAVRGEHLLLQDPRETERPYGWHESRVLIRPSFLKRLQSPVLQDIWRIADKYLHTADEVKIIGYSLPESDGAVRALLNPLGRRLEDGDVEVTVVDPDQEALNRWQGLLGERVNPIKKRFGPEEACD